MTDRQAKKHALKAAVRMHWPTVGDIIVLVDIFGGVSFYQVVNRFSRTIEVQMLNKLASQEGLVIPVKGDLKRRRDCDGQPVFTEHLRLRKDGGIGPKNDMITWELWDGKPKTDTYAPNYGYFMYD